MLTFGIYAVSLLNPLPLFAFHEINDQVGNIIHLLLSPLFQPACLILDSEVSEATIRSLFHFELPRITIGSGMSSFFLSAQIGKLINISWYIQSEISPLEAPCYPLHFIRDFI